jgi:hypothetical protein
MYRNAKGKEAGMTLETFAFENRLKTEKDACGDVIIPGKRGHIYEHGLEILGVCIVSESGNAYSWNRAREAFAAVGMKIRQSGDAEGCATFDHESATQVKTALRYAEISPRKRISPEHRRVAIANLLYAQASEAALVLLKKQRQNGGDIELETRNTT